MNSLAFFEINEGKEILIEKYYSNKTPYVPNNSEIVLLGDEAYKVLNVSVSYYHDDNNHNKIYNCIEVMVQKAYIEKNWWEV